jgi:hypothetical protein
MGHDMLEDGFGVDRGNALYERFVDAPRRFTWINLRTTKFVDGGYRGEQDYGRLALAVEQFAALVAADIYPLSISGEVCTHCSYSGICGGTGLAPNEHGKPGAEAA